MRPYLKGVYKNQRWAIVNALPFDHCSKPLRQVAQSLLPNPAIGIGKYEHICTHLQSSHLRADRRTANKRDEWLKPTKWRKLERKPLSGPISLVVTEAI